jgi:hypothetical protein
MQKGPRIEDKLGPGVLGAQMETHSSLVAFLLCFFSLIL